MYAVTEHSGNAAPSRTDNCSHVDRKDHLSVGSAGPPLADSTSRLVSATEPGSGTTGPFAKRARCASTRIDSETLPTQHPRHAEQPRQVVRWDPGPTAPGSEKGVGDNPLGGFAARPPTDVDLPAMPAPAAELVLGCWRTSPTRSRRP